MSPGAVLSILMVGAQAGSPATTSDARCQPGADCRMALTAAQMFELADRLAARGQAAEAEAVLNALTRDASVDIRSEARFRIGLMHERRRDWDGAARAFRMILEEKPDAGPVRLELARVLAASGDEEGARRQLRLASSAGLPDEVLRIVNQFESALRSRKRLGGSIEFGFAPDNNINRAQRNSVAEVGALQVELSEDARAQSGIGLTVGGQAYWRPPIDGHTNLLVTLSGRGDLYRKSRFDDVNTALSAGPELQWDNSRFRVAGVIGLRWFGGSRYSTSHGVSFNWLRPLDPRSQLQLDLSAIRSNYRINPALSGLTTGMVFRYERALSPRLFGRLSLRASRQEARDPAFATWSTGGELLLAREAGPLTFYGRAGYDRIWADARFSFPPVRRQDRQLDLEAGTALRRFSMWGLAPILRIRWTKNQSPVFFYDFERTRLEFGFTREF
jgi:outer membrane protein